jgi:spore germination protein YaaH
MRVKVALVCLALASLVAGCAWESGENVHSVGLRTGVPLPPRRGTVVSDGCSLDTWQRATLASPAARRVVSEVVLLCLVPREDGTIGPRDPSATQQIAITAAEVRGLGYRFHLAVSFTDESGARYDGAQTRAWISSPTWRARFRDTLVLAMQPADGIELDLQRLPDDARASVTALVSDASAVVRPARRLGVFAPPSVSNPSDLPGGEAFARRELAPLVDRLRVSTLDYSESLPGPTIDTGWAVDAARLALADAREVDVAYPLYGTDFGPRGTRTVSFLEATAMARAWAAPIERGATGAPFVRWTSAEGEPHETWFDDAESTARGLGAWTHDVLPPEVGVVFYGLGAEDPTLWTRLAAGLP